MRPRRGVGPPIGSAERDPAIGEACLEKAMDLSTPGEAYYKRATRGESGQEMRRVIRIRPSAAWLVRLAVVGLVLFSVVFPVSRSPLQDVDTWCGRRASAGPIWSSALRSHP
jgi:hypothetical protein